jgi:hypothetical protein
LGLYNIKFGSRRETALARRHKRVANEIERIGTGRAQGHDSEEMREEEERMDREEEEEEAEGGDEEMPDAGVEEQEIADDVVEDYEIEDDGVDDQDGEGDDVANDGEDVESEEENEGVNEENEGVNEENEGVNEENEGEAENGNEYEDDENNDDDDGDDGNSWADGSQASDDLSDCSEAWSQASELDIEASFDFYPKASEALDGYHEKQSYDPSKLQLHDAQWIDRCRILCINSELKEKKAFMSGRGRYSDYSEFRVVKDGTDPRDTEADSHPCYHAYEPEEQTFGFPMHEACFDVLTRCLGYAHRKDVDKDVMYGVMEQLGDQHSRHLSLDYGHLQGPEQYWECIPGEEYSLADPMLKSTIGGELMSMLPARLFETTVSTLDLSPKVRSDPLTVLPYDVLHFVFAGLSIKDTISLIKASWHVLDSTRDPAFWRLMIRLHIVPFFWELERALKDATFPDTFDWRGMFQWLNGVTKPKFGMDSSLNIIANRRRIWDVCQQIAPRYHEKLQENNYREPSDSNAKPILDSAVCLHSPLVMFPQPTTGELRPITTQFIRSWSEIAYHACDFNTYWVASSSVKGGHSGYLVGISVTFASVERLFGSKDGIKGQSLRIEAGDWFREIVMSVGKIKTWQSAVEKSEITGPEDIRAVSASYIMSMTVRNVKSLNDAWKLTIIERYI